MKDRDRKVKLLCVHVMHPILQVWHQVVLQVQLHGCMGKVYGVGTRGGCMI